MRVAMRIDTATADDVRFVASRMREADLREFCAVNPAYDRWSLAELLVQRYGSRDDIIVALNDDDTAVAIGGVIETRPNTATLLFFATDDFRSVARGLTRWIRDELFPGLKEAGVRIECWSLDGHDVAHRWIEHLGLKRRYTDPGFGKDGEPFVLFTWIPDANRSTAA
jgi:hypothetical protein